MEGESKMLAQLPTHNKPRAARVIYKTVGNNCRMIDKITGAVELNSRISFIPNLELEIVNRMTNTLNHDHKNLNNGFEQLVLEKVKIKEKKFWFLLLFENNKLKQITINFYFNTEINDSKAELKIYEDWITKELGPKRTFDWGTAGAYSDHWTMHSRIEIKYG